ncbi:MAG TPA: C25 family cysteine peptidase [Candidatus Saccharimonadales bacterium]|nr:C25 family cysteine peptidase [Candidatus Saccharimonadales bacterium]
MREQRFAEIIYTPIVAPPGGGKAIFYSDIEVDLVVEGVEPGAISAVKPPADPYFEKAYRAALVNYQQGRTFRRRRASPIGATATTAGVATTAGATIQSGFPTYEISLSTDGIYRLTQPYLVDPNSGVAPGLAGADPRQFKLMNRGVEVPIYVAGEGDGSFDPGDSIEFYGQRLDGPETILNYDMGLLPDIYQYDDYGDRNVYWLSVDPNGTRARIPDRAAPPNAGDPLEPDFAERLHFEKDNLYQPTGGADPFLMTPRLDSNNGTTVADPNNCSYTDTGIPNESPGKYLGPDITDPNDPNYCAVCRLTLPGIDAAAAQAASVDVVMRGTTDDPNANPDHLAVVELNGNPALSSTHCWDRNVFTTQSVSLAQSQLTPTLDIRIEQPGLSTTGNEQLLVDYVEVAYRRLFSALGDKLKFTVPDAPKRIAVGALTSGSASSVTLFETTKTISPVVLLGGPAVVSPVRVTGGVFTGGSGNFTLTFNNDDDPNSTADRTYVVAGPGGFLLPESVTQAPSMTLSDPTREADVIVIGDSTLMDQSPSSPFSLYWSHRASADGLAVAVVTDDEIYQEFGYGIEHPEAIRRFLEYAYDNWKGPSLDPNRPPPAFVTLVGDTTVDPKNLLNRSDWANLLPAFIMYQESAILGFYASDNYIAAFHGADQLPDVHLGRIPIRTAAEADDVFTKLLEYDSPPAGTWRGRGVFITDEGKEPGESADFERITNNVINNNWQPQPPLSYTKLYYDEPPYNGNDPSGFHNVIKANLDAGTALMQYTGHGAFSIYGVDGYWASADVASLAPTGGKYFMAVNENCLSGGFHFIAQDALSEAFLKAPDKGAVAFFAPAGLSFATIGESINIRLYGDIFGPQRMRRFGEMITDIRALLSNLSILDLQSYMLIGDPTQNFELPAPASPQNFIATGGDKQVTLSWTPGADPNAGVSIFRASSPTGTYTEVTPGPVFGTSFVDPNLKNATTYYYEAASVDADGYEGARTNTNTDCDIFNPPASGPDCVWGKPLNPNPPQTPQDAIVFGDGSGVRLTVSWTPNPETDIGAYVVDYGTQQGGPYPNEVTAGAAATSVLVPNLTEGTQYYMVLMAKNTSGLLSAPTSELTGIPQLFAGEAPPAMIQDLQIELTPGDPNSLTLTWTHSGLDIYGSPTTLASFDIYRGETPGFMPSAANRVAVISDPAIETWTDHGAAAAAPNYYYLVGAKDARGFESGLGLDLPKGVIDLEASETGGGSTIHFAWSPVTQDVQGNTTLIAKYVLYASAQPISRGDVDSMTPLVDNITGTALDVPVNPSHEYYTLIVVDTRGNKSPY